jgi:hypothetical protein
MGSGVSKTDKRSRIIFDHTRFYSLYNKDTLEAGIFKRLDHSCDSKYMDINLKGDFILLKPGNDERCYEITGLTNSTLAYRHTVSGSLHVFNRK